MNLLLLYVGQTSVHRSSTKDFNAALCSHHYAGTAGATNEMFLQEIRSALCCCCSLSCIGIEFGVANRIVMVLRNICIALHIHLNLIKHRPPPPPPRSHRVSPYSCIIVFIHVLLFGGDDLCRIERSLWSSLYSCVTL